MVLSILMSIYLPTAQKQEKSTQLEKKKSKTYYLFWPVKTKAKENQIKM